MDPFIDLLGKNIIITGAASGIGRMTAISIAKQGANVILLDLNEKELNRTKDLITSKNVLLITLDLMNFETYEDAIKQAVEHFGKIDGLVHCAGIEYTLPLKILKPEQYLNLFKINTIAGFELTKIICKKKNMSQERCSIVLISSIMAIVGRKGLAGYSASKGAIVSGVKSIALELAPKNVNINCISPGTIETELIKKLLSNLSQDQRKERLKGYPLGIGKPEYIADTAIFLLSKRSKWITGTNIVVDGGYTAS